MPLAALIIADEEHHAAAQPLVMGLPVVEYQARLAQQAGANHIVVVTAQVAAGLVSALDRLRARGVNVALARTAREAADLVHPDETVLLFDAGSIPAPELLDRLAAGEGMRIATFPLDPRFPERELIDADHAWAGLARVDGNIVRKTAEILGDWALAPTLLRFAVQAGASRERLEDGASSLVCSVHSAAEAALVTRSLVGGAQQAMPGLTALALGPLSGLVAAQVGRFALPPLAFELLAAGLLLMSGVAALTGWASSALVLIPVAALVGHIAARLGRAALGQHRLFVHFPGALAWAGRLALIAAGTRGWAGGWGWGSVAVSLWLIWELWQAGRPQARFDPDETSAAVIAGTGLVAGHPIAGLGLALAFQILSRFSGMFRRQA